jgi:DNA-directed RNA polymerase specialized sigma subunit
MPESSLVDYNDLLQHVQLEMWKYLEKYDPSRGTTFMQFFGARVNGRLNGAIIDALRELQDCTRLIAQWRRVMAPMFATLRNELGRQPTLEEFCDKFGWHHEPILRNRAFWAGTFNQRQVGGSVEQQEEGDLDALQNFQSRDGAVSSDQQRMVSKDNMRFIRSHLKDPDMDYIVWAYYEQHETNEQILRDFRCQGRKCSLSWVVSKHNRAKEIIKEKVGRAALKMMVENADK